MDRIKEYLRATTDLGGCVNNISRQLNKNNQRLHDLTEQLKSLFHLFSRGDELLRILQDYSKNLQRDVNELKLTHRDYGTTIEAMNDELLFLSNSLKTITNLLKDIHANAGLFVDSARALAKLAKNTEIRAYHAKKEGIGLAVIAKESLELAEQAQTPFENISALLDNLKTIAQPFVEKLHNILDLSARSRALLNASLNSLTTIDSTTNALQNIITRVDDNSKINNQLKVSVNKGMEALNEQMTTSLSTIDDLSIRCAQIHSLSQKLNTLNNIQQQIDKYQSTTFQSPHINTQFQFISKENNKYFKKFTTKRTPPLFPAEVYQNIENMTQHIHTLLKSTKEFSRYKDKLGAGMTEIVDLIHQIENFIKETYTVKNYLNTLSYDLSQELTKIEKLIHATNTLFGRIKTLAVFAKIEEGRSSEYRTIITPTVDDFIRLERETEKAFSRIKPQLKLLKKSISFLKKSQQYDQKTTVRFPDYSKVKIFLDDIIRVFSEEKDHITQISQLASDLQTSNKALSQTWENFEQLTANTSYIIEAFTSLGQKLKDKAPAIIPTKTSVNIALSDDPLTLKPELKTDVTSHLVICNFSTGLFNFGAGVNIIPGLCEEYTISEDGTKYTFIMRKGLNYHNGGRVKIEHLRDALFRVLKGPNFSFFDMIKGARQFNKDKDNSHLSIHILNNMTLQIILEYPFLPILANFATNIADPYIDAALPVGTGPFCLENWDRGKEILLRAHDSYFEGRPAFDELRFRIVKDENEGYELFKEGQISVLRPTGSGLEKLRQTNPDLLHTIAELSIYFLCINCQKKPFDNLSIRKAMAYAIDTEKMVNLFLRGSAIPAMGIFPPSLNAFNHACKGYPYDPNKAKELLKQAGFRQGLPDSYPFDISDNPSVIERAVFVQQNLADVGIRIEVNPMPWHDLIEKTFAGESFLSFRGWISDNGDPDNFVYPLFHSTSQGRTGNTFFFSSPEIDALMDRARRIRNFDARINLYQTIEKKIIEQSPGVFLYHRLQNIALQKNILGLKPHPLGLIRTKSILPLDLGAINEHNSSNGKN